MSDIERAQALALLAQLAHLILVIGRRATRDGYSELAVLAHALDLLVSACEQPNEHTPLDSIRTFSEGPRLG